MGTRLCREQWWLLGMWQPRRRRACPSGAEVVGRRRAQARGEGASKRWAHETNVTEYWWVSFKIVFGMMYRKSNVRRKGWPVGCNGGSLESHPPAGPPVATEEWERNVWWPRIVTRYVSCALAQRTAPILVGFNQCNQQWGSPATGMKADCCFFS